MELVIAVAFHPYVILTLLAYMAVFAIAGNPATVLKVSPADTAPLAHSLAFYRSVRAVVCPALMWLAVILWAASFSFFRLSLHMESVLVFLHILAAFGLVFALRRAEEHLMRRFLKRFSSPVPPRH